MIYILLALALTLTRQKMRVISITFDSLKVRYQWLHRFDSKPAHHQDWQPNHHQKHQHVGKLARV